MIAHYTYSDLTGRDNTKTQPKPNRKTVSAPYLATLYSCIDNDNKNSPLPALLLRTQLYIGPATSTYDGFLTVDTGRDVIDTVAEGNSKLWGRNITTHPPTMPVQSHEQHRLALVVCFGTTVITSKPLFLIQGHLLTNNVSFIPTKITTTSSTIPRIHPHHLLVARKKGRMSNQLQ